MLKVKGLSCSYNGKAALNDISFDLCGGDFLGVIGANGAGKTTLLKSIAGVLMPHSGGIVFAGNSRGETPQAIWVRHIALLPQDFYTPFGLLVEEVVLMGRLPHSEGFFETKNDYRVAQKAMRATGVESLATRQINTLSGGERQRVLIAKALAQEPMLLLLDEPTSSLDIKHQNEILALVKNIAAQQGMIVVAAMHNINAAIRHSTKMLLLKEGKMLGFGAPEDVISASTMREVYDAPISVVNNEGVVWVVS